MERRMMNGICGAGMRRLANPFTVALVVASQASPAFAQATTHIVVRGKADTVLVRGDSTRATTFERRAVLDIRRVDSLLKQQETVPIGSEEYAHIQRELESMIFTALPGARRAVAPDGQVTITVSPGMERTPPPAFAIPKLMVDVTPRGW